MDTYLLLDGTVQESDMDSDTVGVGVGDWCSTLCNPLIRKCPSLQSKCLLTPTPAVIIKNWKGLFYDIRTTTCPV